MNTYTQLSENVVTEVALNSGLELKQLDDGTMGLRPYIFSFAENLIKTANNQSADGIVYFPAKFHPYEEGNGFVVTFRDIPEAITQGSTFAEAIEYAEDALDVCKDFYEDRPYPTPSAPQQGDVMIGVKVETLTSTGLFEENGSHESEER